MPAISNAGEPTSADVAFETDGNSDNPSPGWRLAGSVLLVSLGLALALHQPTLHYLTGLWNELEIGEYSHGYVVLAISALLIFRDRHRLAQLAPDPNPWALIGVFVAATTAMLAALIDVSFAQAPALLMLLLAIAWTLLGNRITSHLVLPALFIGFAIPVWFPLLPLLQHLTTSVVYEMLNLLGVPASRNANTIELSAGNLRIDESCAGLRYLLVALTLGTLYAHLNYTGRRARILVVLVAAFGAIFANCVRVFVVVYLGFRSDMQHPLIYDHLMLGWYIFGGALLLLLLLEAILHRCIEWPAGGEEARAAEGSPASGMGRGAFAVLSLAVIVLLSAGPAIVYRLDHRPLPGAAERVLSLPASIGDWNGFDTAVDDWRPVYQGATNLKRSYRRADDRLVLYVGYYPAQRQHTELINELNGISDGVTWRLQNSHPQLISAGDRPVLAHNMIRRDGKKRRVWYWYRVADRDTGSEYQAKLLQLVGLLSGHEEALVIAVAAAYDGDPDDADLLLRDFVASMEPGQILSADQEH